VRDVHSRKLIPNHLTFLELSEAGYLEPPLKQSSCFLLLLWITGRREKLHAALSPMHGHTSLASMAIFSHQQKVLPNVAEA